MLDGGLATTLESRGYEIAGPLWSARLVVDAPNAIRQTSLDFLLAGADIVSTVTYQASQTAFEKVCNLSQHSAVEAMRTAVKLTVDARDEFWAECERVPSSRRKPLVALSLGPYGAFLSDGSEYTGTYGLGEGASVSLYNFHKSRIQVFFGTSSSDRSDQLHAPDIIAFETIPCISEAVAITRLARDKSALHAVPFWISFQCKSATLIASDESLRDAVFSVLVANEHNEALVGLGINCVKPEYVHSLVSIVQTTLSEFQEIQTSERMQFRRLYTIAYPNNGEVWTGSGWTTPDSSLSRAAWAKLLLSSTADIVGGCCRCDPNYVSIANVNHACIGPGKAWYRED